MLEYKIQERENDFRSEAWEDEVLIAYAQFFIEESSAFTSGAHHFSEVLDANILAGITKALLAFLHQRGIDGITTFPLTNKALLMFFANNFPNSTFTQRGIDITERVKAGEFSYVIDNFLCHNDVQCLDVKDRIEVFIPYGGDV